MLVWEPATWYCTSMFWLIDSCQNSVSADQYRLTVSRAQVSTLWVRVIFKDIRWQVATLQMIEGSSSIFLKCIWNESCFISRSFKMLISNCSRTRKFNRLLHLHAGKAIALTFLTVTRWSRSKSNFYVLIGQNLTGVFMRKIFAASGNLLTDSWSWESFVSSCHVLNCLFLLGIQNEIQLLSRLFCN